MPLGSPSARGEGGSPTPSSRRWRLSRSDFDRPLPQEPPLPVFGLRPPGTRRFHEFVEPALVDPLARFLRSTMSASVHRPRQDPVPVENQSRAVGDLREAGACREHVQLGSHLCHWYLLESSRFEPRCERGHSKAIVEQPIDRPTHRQQVSASFRAREKSCAASGFDAADVWLRWAKTRVAATSCRCFCFRLDLMVWVTQPLEVRQRMVVRIVDVVAVGPRCRAPPSGAHPFTSVVRAARDDLAQRLPVRREFVASGRRRESVARSGHESPPIENEDRSA